MFRNSYQNGLLSIFYSCGADPLAIWDTEVHNGHIKRMTDDEVNSIVLEMCSTNVTTTYMTCPRDNKILGIKLPFLVMIIKNLKRYFTFEITILDDKNLRRRFSIANFQSATKIKPFCTSMPIGLADGWNQIQFNLADFTKRAYGTQFRETLRVQIHANCRLRRVYFCERLFTEEELPQEYKLYLPLDRKQKKGKGKETKEEAPAPKVEKPVEAADSAPAPAPVPSRKMTVVTPQVKEPEDVEVTKKGSVASGHVSDKEGEEPIQADQEAEGAPQTIDEVASGEAEGQVEGEPEPKPANEVDQEVAAGPESEAGDGPNEEPPEE